MSKSSPPPQRPSSRPNNGVVAIVAVVVVAVIVGFVAIGLLVGNGPSASPLPAAGYGKTTAPTTPTQPPGHTQAPPVTQPPPTSAQPTNLPALHCTTPPPLPKKPLQFAKPPAKTLAANATWKVTLTTNCGDIVMNLDGKDAPQTVSSFLFLAQKKFFDDTKCHRLTTPDQGLSVLQCGDPTGTGSGGPGYGYGIENAPADGAYPTGTVAMARTTDPNSNGSQFFIVYGDTTLPTDGGGYSIFGKVTAGLPIVQAIAAKGLATDGESPAQPISILHVTAAKA